MQEDPLYETSYRHLHEISHEKKDQKGRTNDSDEQTIPTDSEESAKLHRRVITKNLGESGEQTA